MPGDRSTRGTHGVDSMFVLVDHFFFTLTSPTALKCSRKMIISQIG